MQLSTLRPESGRTARSKAVRGLFLVVLAACVLSFPFAAYASGVTVTVKTDQASYSGAQSLTVSGMISPAPSASGTNVVVKVSGPSGSEVLFSEGVVSTTDGSYSLRFVTGGPNWIAGTYTVNATYVFGSASGTSTTKFAYSLTATTTTSTISTSSRSTTTSHSSSTTSTTSSTTQITTTCCSTSTYSPPSSTTTTSSSSTTSPTPSTTSSSTTSSSGGIPEFPFQFLILVVFTAALASAYVVTRSRGGKGYTNR